MKNRPRDLRQSETEKYLESIIISNYWMDRAEYKSEELRRSRRVLLARSP